MTDVTLYLSDDLREYVSAVLLLGVMLWSVKWALFSSNRPRT